MNEPKKEENSEQFVSSRFVEINKRKVKLKRMHVIGTRSIANGIKLELEHMFGLPNVLRNPYMVFCSEEDRFKVKTGIPCPFI